jgi:2-oxoglutarate ferredoxin oxidoreductase subunit beta
MIELLAALETPAYLARVAVTDPAKIRQAGRAVRRALEVQMAGTAFSLVEAIGVCPTNLHLPPVEAVAWAKEHVLPRYELGELKVP